MSISDELMWKYYTALHRPDAGRDRRERKRALHPMDAKRELAKSIIRDFHDAAAADAAEEEFRRVFSERQAPAEIEESHAARVDRTAAPVARSSSPPASPSRTKTRSASSRRAACWSTTRKSATLARRWMQPPASRMC